MLNIVPEEDKQYLENQLQSLSELRENVIRNAVAKQEDLMRKILQQQDFDTQLESSIHVLKEVEASLSNELQVEADLPVMKEKLAHLEVICLLLLLCKRKPCTYRGNIFVAIVAIVIVAFFVLSKFDHYLFLFELKKTMGHGLNKDHFALTFFRLCLEKFKVKKISSITFVKSPSPSSMEIHQNVEKLWKN